MGSEAQGNAAQGAASSTPPSDGGGKKEREILEGGWRIVYRNHIAFVAKHFANCHIPVGERAYACVLVTATQPAYLSICRKVVLP